MQKVTTNELPPEYERIAKNGSCVIKPHTTNQPSEYDLVFETVELRYAQILKNQMLKRGQKTMFITSAKAPKDMKDMPLDFHAVMKNKAFNKFQEDKIGSRTSTFL